MLRSLKPKTTKFAWMFLQLFITIINPLNTKLDKTNSIHNPYFTNKIRNNSFVK